MARFSFWFGLTGLILGAIVGAIDLDFLGGFAGGLLGCFTGALFGEALDLLIAPFFGTKEDRTKGKWVLRFIGLAILVVFCHELFWAINLVSLTATHNIGARITRYVGRNETKESVQEMLRDKRWQVQVFISRPTSWLLPGDVFRSTKATDELIDAVVRNRVAVDSVLHYQGKDIAVRAEGLVDKYIARTWLLRFVPRDVLIPKEGP